MSNESNVKSVCVKSQSQSLVELMLKMYSKISFTEIVEELSERFYVKVYKDVRDRCIAKQLVRVMAEVLCLPDDAEVRIEKILHPARDVKEVYVQLSTEQFLTVMQNYKRIDYPIKHLKAYYKVQLYNSFFEV